MPILTNQSPASELAEYEDFVANSPHGHMMQSVNWSQVKSNWRADFVYLRGADGSIKAALSILSIANDGQHSFLYAPRGPVCDLANVELVSALTKEAQPVIEKHNGFLLRMDPEVTYSPDLVQMYTQAGFTVRSREIEDPHAFSNPRINMVANLSGLTQENLIENYSRKAKNKIRKPYKSGITTRLVSVDEDDYLKSLDEFYHLTEIMAQRQGITYRPKEYFARLMRAFDDSKLFVTSYDADGEREVLSSCIVVSYNRKSFYMYAASSNEKRNLLPNHQMNFEAIKYAISRGMSEYDMGGVYSTETDDGLFNFKHHFTGDEGIREMLGEIDLVIDEARYRDFVANH
ncbi:peptidoglycan bridge formation glycyltransferase FemA/FemB family protein [uncultured Mobiluncus sp.]|uniref:lipid II:glycine glycyltransferase FemX n=1 Tax=uncultured Mobiluncus sp. TaxID=293425 RepID=UPI00288BCBB1|nr:peptidoglycan bridge formation glycyltransferase FemA/FemB family protein [uncultured Mobiluncus sp.]